MPPDDDLDELRRQVWQRLSQAHHGVRTSLDSRLVDRCDMTLAEFEVLASLGDARDRRLRMRELARRTRLSPSGLSRRFDTLSRRGLVRRVQCDDDGRGVLAELSEEGLERLSSARPVHDGQLQRDVMDHLEREQLRVLADALARIEPTGDESEAGLRTGS